LLLLKYEEDEGKPCGVYDEDEKEDVDEHEEYSSDEDDRRQEEEDEECIDDASESRTHGLVVPDEPEVEGRRLFLVLVMVLFGEVSLSLAVLVVLVDMDRLLQCFGCC